MKRRVSKISKKSQVLCDSEIQSNQADTDGHANGNSNAKHSKPNHATKTAVKVNKDALPRDNYNSHPDIPWAVALLTYLSYAIIIAVSDYL